jgi:SAM-dependent methyltransferase
LNAWALRQYQQRCYLNNEDLMMIKRIYTKLKTGGISGFIHTAIFYIRPHRLSCYPQLKPFFRGRSGLEIGGPSKIFSRVGLIPVYTMAARVDNCNFSKHTIWEADILEGDTFHFDKRKAPGKQYVGEATNLTGIASYSCDFVISSHVLEHIANPLQALKEWIRVLKVEGLLVLVVPHKDGTFDRFRPVTTLDHLIHDFQNKTTEADMTHLKEILSLHDLGRDPEAGDFEAFKQRSTQNPENRCLHHHVFNTRLAVDIIHHAGMRILAVETFLPYHIVVVAQKPTVQSQIQNDRFKGMLMRPCWTSPFPSDQRL